MKKLDPLACSLLVNPAARVRHEYSFIGSSFAGKPIIEIVVALDNGKWISCPPVGGNTFDRDYPFTVGSSLIRDQASPGDDHLRFLSLANLEDGVVEVVDILWRYLGNHSLQASIPMLQSLLI